MNSRLSIGVARSGSEFAVATIRRGKPVEEVLFPLTHWGAQAIRIFLTDCTEPYRLAVTDADLGLVLGCAHGRDQQAIVASAAVAHNASGLASFAARCL